MPNTLKLLILVFLISIVSCTKDDVTIDAVTVIDSQELKNETKKIASDKIPHIIDYLKKRTSGTMRFEIQSYNNDTRSIEPDLILGEAQMDEILESINSYDRKNYSFKLETFNERNPIYISYFNLVVKETLRGVYAYIAEYRMTRDWVGTQTGSLNMTTFTGELVFYTDTGAYVGDVSMDNGTATDYFLNDPCGDGGSDSDGNTDNGTGTWDTGTGDTGGDSDTGADGDTGGGTGGIISITTVENCEIEVPCSHPEHQVDHQTAPCTHPDCGIEFVIDIKFEGDEMTTSRNLGEVMRNPGCETPDDCNQQNDCEFGFDENCGCLPEEEEEIENDEVGVNVDLEEYIIANEIEDNINSVNLDPCSNNILTQLKNLQQNDIANIIYRFGAPASGYNLVMQTGVPSNPLHQAETDWYYDVNGNALPKNYVTVLRNSYTDQATTIAIARTILHEILHAYMLSKVDDGDAQVPVNIAELPVLWDAVMADLYNDDPEAVQHQQMAEKFITPMRDALREWDNNQQSSRYYEDLAWGALYETSTFIDLYPEDSESYTRILRTNIAEDSNSPQEDILPLGDSCQ
ncbi:hypothetical protein [Dokdonia sinensis]|nr:hypothetical protein [Dokdonia sinensis]